VSLAASPSYLLVIVDGPKLMLFVVDELSLIKGMALSSTSMKYSAILSPQHPSTKAWS